MFNDSVKFPGKVNHWHHWHHWNFDKRMRKMDLECIMLSKVSQTERQILYDITYMWNLKKYNKLVNITKNSRLTDIENKLAVTSGEREGGR